VGRGRSWSLAVGRWLEEGRKVGRWRLIVGWRKAGRLVVGG
jgi:hypothetical protein